MFNNPYMPVYNQQTNIDRINTQIAELEKMKTQMQQPVQPTNLTQNFQLAPTNRDVIKYATSIDEVQRDMVIGDTPFFSKDMSVVWIKNTKGEIKTYELNEIVPKDAKDIQIEYLQSQIEELRKEMKKNDANVTGANAGSIEIGLKENGVPVLGASVNEVVTPDEYQNVAFTKLIRLCPRENVTLTIGSIPAVSNVIPAIETVAPTIKNANIIIEKVRF